jgi:hypothetical protein
MRASAGKLDRSLRADQLHGNPGAPYQTAPPHLRSAHQCPVLDITSVNGSVVVTPPQVPVSA